VEVGGEMEAVARMVHFEIGAWISFVESNLSGRATS
jgi:hypothetical protein